ncbi:hypothetical protein [Rhizobium sp. 11515TR]|uniref:hypothetical protein n=1 Tax=Rhizobium sp. 11515TR TaxID=2028343 RepID=UPI0011B53F51|nr:hypothetical protein [Rhizobium sp. 11515TR]
MANETISITIPDIDSLSDDELSNFLSMRDGRWSQQTKDLLAKFGTNKLNLNRAWAGLWQSWSCPCCGRNKSEIARINSAGVLLCQIEVHHDHLGDWAERKFSELNPRSDEKAMNLQIDWCKQPTLQLVERFPRTAICLDCNLVEGKAKACLGKEIFRDFSFSPSEIAQFITVQANQVHGFDRGKVAEIWKKVKDDVEDRIDFATRMARRFANGKNRRQVGGRSAPEFWIDSEALFWRMLGRDSSLLSNSRLAERIVARSTARDAVGNSTVPKTRRPGKPPTDAEYEAIDLQNAEQKHWARFSENWKCDCCGRSKRSICRKANSGKWTARIHAIRDWKFTGSEEDYSEDEVRGNFYIADHVPAFICQDCRHVISEMQRRDDSLSENSVTLSDVKGSISTIAANEMHQVDYEYLIDRAYENHGLQDAIASYLELEGIARSYLERANSIMKRHRCSFEQARDHLVHDHATLLGKSVTAAADHVEWYLVRAHKFEALREIELGRAPLAKTGGER